MCLPLAPALMIGSAAIAGVTSAMEVASANQQAAQMGQSANNALASDYTILNRRQQEVNQQATAEETERMRQGLRERGKLMVAAGEAGVGGVTPMREIYNSLFKTQFDQGLMDVNRENQILSAQDYKMGSYATAESRINQAKSMAYNPFTAILKIGGSMGSAALSGYATGAGLEGGAGFKLPNSSYPGAGTYGVLPGSPNWH